MKGKDPIQEYFDKEPDESCCGTCADLDAPSAPPDGYYKRLDNSERVQHLLHRRKEGNLLVVQMVVMFFASGLFFLAVDSSKKSSHNTRLAAYSLCTLLAGLSLIGFFLIHCTWLRPVQRELDELQYVDTGSSRGCGPVRL